MDVVQWCIDKHAQTNHMYDEYLPYEFHLRMVFTVGKQFSHLLSDDVKGYVLLSLYGHDLMEDARQSYNDLVKVLGKQTADIIYALTNEKGHDRDEKADERYYKGIRQTEYADFAKLCDRIANVQYSKMTQSSMFKKYQKENDHFLIGIGACENGHRFQPMINYLIDLFTSPMPIK